MTTERQRKYISTYEPTNTGQLRNHINHDRKRSTSKRLCEQDWSTTLENTFYTAFIKDLKRCESEAIIESPYITTRRLSELLPVLGRLKSKKIRVVINTRDPRSINEEYRREDTQEAVSRLQHLGVHVVLTPNHHRKLAIMDRSILYEGSLNILSQNNSTELMRRIESINLSWQMIKFLKIDDHF